MYKQCIKYYCQRYSNNSKPLFSDEEILTIYLFVGQEQKYTQVKDIHNFAKEYLLDWFPHLVSYQTFNYRLNRMVGAVTELSKQLLDSHRPKDCEDDTLIVDSFPVMTCTGRNRKGKVAIEIADKGYCSTKKTVLPWPQNASCRIQAQKAYPVPTPDHTVLGIRERPDCIQAGLRPAP